MIWIASPGKDLATDTLEKKLWAGGGLMSAPQPTTELLERFEAIVQPGFLFIHKLNLQIENLRPTRDLLLPGSITPRL